LHEGGATIQIGVNIKSTVPDDKHNQVMTGIYASGDVEIKRDEIYAKIQESNNG
jgi:carbon storage regulator CsrA